MKIGRNDPCPCGSGKKYKKCCMGKSNPAQIEPYLETMDGIIPVNISDRPVQKAILHISPEERALDKAMAQVVKLKKEDREEDAARKFLEATAHVQKVSDDFCWDMGEIAADISGSLRRDAPELAVAVLERAIVLDPENASLWKRDMGEIMIISGNVDEGFAVLHKLSEEYPDDIWSWIALGRNYVDTREYEKATEYLYRAIQVGEIQTEKEKKIFRSKVDIGTAYIHLFDAYNETGKTEEAIQAWEKATQYDDFYNNHASNVCDMLMAQGHLDRAYEFAGRIKFDDVRNYYLGKILLMQGDEKKALSHWNKVLGNTDDFNKTLWAEVALRLGKHQLVIQELTSYLKRNPKHLFCRIFLSIAHAIEGDMKSVDRVLSKAQVKVDISDENISLFRELLPDDAIHSGWFDMLSRYVIRH